MHLGNYKKIAADDVMVDGELARTSYSAILMVSL